MTEGRGNEAGDNVERSSLEPKESLKGESISSTEQNTDHKKVIEDQRSRPESFKSFSDGMPAINPLVLEDSLTGDVFYDAGKRNSTVQADDASVGTAGTAGGTDLLTGVGDSTDAVSLAESDVGSPDAAAGSGNSTVDAILAAAQNQAPPEAGMMQIGGKWYRQDQLVAANVESGFPGQEMRTATDATAALSPAEVQRQGGLKSVQDLQRLLPPGTSVRIQYHPDQRDPFDYLFSNNCPPETWKPIVAAINAEMNSETLPNDAPLFDSLRGYAVQNRGKWLPSDSASRNRDPIPEKEARPDKATEALSPSLDKGQGESRDSIDVLMHLRGLIPAGASVKIENGRFGCNGFTPKQEDAFNSAVFGTPGAGNALREFAASSPDGILRSGYLQPQVDTAPDDNQHSGAESTTHPESHWKPGDKLVANVNQTDLRPATDQVRFTDGVQQSDRVNEYLAGSGFVQWNGRAVEVTVSPDAITPVSANAPDGYQMGVSIQSTAGEGDMSAKAMYGRLATINGSRYFQVESVLTIKDRHYPLPHVQRIPLNTEIRPAQSNVWKY